MQILRNVVGIVSGGASGLGAATVAQIVRNGGKVVVADLPSQRDNFLRLAASSCAEVATVGADKEVAEGVNCKNTSSTKGQEKSDGPVLAFAETDVTNEDQVAAALDMAEEKFGEPVNAAINCAGIAAAKKTLSSKGAHPLVDFNNVLQVNTLGSFNVARLAAERMAGRLPDPEGLRGCIVNTASIAAYEGQIGQVAYAASKGAIVGMTLPMARDLSPQGIRVMTVAPGLFKTPLLEGLPEPVQNSLGAMVPCPARLGDPDEFGRLIVSILTNPMLNGEVIRLDGALRMPPQNT